MKRIIYAAFWHEELMQLVEFLEKNGFTNSEVLEHLKNLTHVPAHAD